MQKIRKNDLVKMALGKDRGKEGKVLRVLGKEERVVIEGVNVYKRHIKKMGQTEGQIISISKSVDISNVFLLCPNCKKPTRVGFKIDGNKKLRVCKKCKEVIK